MTEILDLEKLTNIIKDILDNEGFRLYDVYFNDVSKTLRVFIDRQDAGITIGDCKRVSTIISKEIDEMDVVTFPYTLEVSSPGIERPLKRPEHYQWAIGKFVEIDLSEKKLKGFLRDTRDNGVVVATDMGENFIAYDSILKARIVEDI